MPQFNPYMMIMAREARGLTQAELATRLKLVQGKLSKYETGFGEPGDEFVTVLAEGLGFRRDFFFEPGRPYGFPPLPLREKKKTVRQIAWPHSRGNEHQAHASFEDVDFV